MFKQQQKEADLNATSLLGLGTRFIMRRAVDTVEGRVDNCSILVYTLIILSGTVILLIDVHREQLVSMFLAMQLVWLQGLYWRL